MIFKHQGYILSRYMRLLLLYPCPPLIPLVCLFDQIINTSPIPFFPQINETFKIADIQHDSTNFTPFYSLVLSTFNRYSCFSGLFPKLLRTLPNYTELVISDDGSNETNKINLLNLIDKQSKQCRHLFKIGFPINSSLLPYCNVYITRHDKSYGSFHTKLDGFLFARGQFIMTIDDDDDFDSNYYKEMVEVMEKYRNITNQIDGYDFFITKNNFYKIFETI